MSVGLMIYNLFSSFLVSMSVVGFFSGCLSVMLGISLVIEWEIFELNSTMVSMSLVFDWMSLFFLGGVSLISGCIMKYSEYYMEGEVNFTRFSYLLSAFVVSMWLLIVSPNMVSLLLGWDGLGLTSYALVIFYQGDLSCNAGMLTVLSNRIGDVAVLMSIGMMYSLGQFDFYGYSGSFDKELMLLVMLAASTKSAQVPFSSWLPAAMAAPTPVSALVHSSTLVTAGVYLLIRFSKEVESSGVNNVLLIMAVSTMIMAGLSAMGEMDLKKVVALSTLSQLGLMVSIVSMGMKDLAFFHLMTHAMFKSSLFMCVGFMIHSVKGSQDMRSMNGFQVSGPFLGVVLGGTNLALCGFPFLAGFYSKDSLLESILSTHLNLLIKIMMVVGVGLTVSYSLRVLRLSSTNNSVLSTTSGAVEMSSVAMKSVAVLFLMSLSGGFVFFWVCVPIMSAPVLSMSAKSSVGLVSLFSGFVMFNFLEKSVGFGKNSLKFMENFVINMWFMPFLSTKLSSLGFIKLGSHNIKMLELGWFEHYGAQGGQAVLMRLSMVFQSAQNNTMVGSYILATMVCWGFWLGFNTSY